MSRLVDAILDLSGPAAYGLVALFAFGEAAVFVGLVLPGELAVLLGGVVASGGQASLGTMIVVACTAAIAGDSVGYEVGRRVGPRILGWEPFHRRFGGRVDQATTYLQDRGGRAVLFGRWTALMRALVPGLAGMARMPYRRFLVFNVVGGTLWASTFVLLGYVAGESWRTVERVAGRASLLLLVVVLGIVLVRFVTRRLVRNADAVRAWLVRVTAWRPVVWVAERFAVPLGWARDRLTPGASRGLGWTITVLVAGAGAWVTGFAVQDLLAGEELVLLDRPTAAWIAAHTTAPAMVWADRVAVAVSPPYGLWLLLAAAALAWRWRDRRAAVRVLLAGFLAASLATLLAGALPPSIAGTTFPSVPVAWMSAALVAVVSTADSHDLRTAIRVSGAGLVLLLVAGMADLVAERSTLSGIIAAAGIGTLIGIGGELSARISVASPVAPPLADAERSP